MQISHERFLGWDFSEEESDEIAAHIKRVLEDNNVHYREVNSSTDIAYIIKHIIK